MSNNIVIQKGQNEATEEFGIGPQTDPNAKTNLPEWIKQLPDEIIIVGDETNQDLFPPVKQRPIYPMNHWARKAIKVGGEKPMICPPEPIDHRDETINYNADQSILPVDDTGYWVDK